MQLPVAGQGTPPAPSAGGPQGHRFIRGAAPTPKAPVPERRVSRLPGEMGRSRQRRRGAGRGAAPRRGLPGEHRPPPGGGVSSLRPGNGTGTGTGTGPSALPADGGARLQTAPAMRLRAARSRFKATPCRGWGERPGPPAAAPARRASRGATLSGEGASAEPARGEGAARRRPEPGEGGRGRGGPGTAAALPPPPAAGPGTL